jgi:hypothetical protein
MRAPMTIHVGLGDLPAIRATFAKALAETVSPLSIRAIGHLLQALRSDGEIDRLHCELFGWRRVARRARLGTCGQERLRISSAKFERALRTSRLGALNMPLTAANPGV